MIMTVHCWTVFQVTNCNIGPNILPCRFYYDCGFVCKYGIDLWFQQMHQTGMKTKNITIMLYCKMNVQEI